MDRLAFEKWPWRESVSVTRDGWVVSLEMEANGTLFSVVCGWSNVVLFKNNFPYYTDFDTGLKGQLCAESHIFSSSYAVRIFTLQWCHTIACSLDAVLAFSLGLFRKSQEEGEGKRDERERDGKSKREYLLC